MKESPSATGSRTARSRRARVCGPRSFSRSSGLERGRSGGLAGRALARTQRRDNASRRRRESKWGAAQGRFRRRKLQRGRVDVGPCTRGRRRGTEVRSRDASGGPAIPVLRAPRAPILAASKEQQAERSKKAYQDGREVRRHSQVALTSCWNVPMSTPPINQLLALQERVDVVHHSYEWLRTSLE